MARDGKEYKGQVQFRAFPEDQEELDRLAEEARVSVSRLCRWLVRKALWAGLGKQTAEELRQDDEASVDAA